MANLHGRVEGERGTATRTASRIIGATLKTREGWVTVDLRADGGFTVYIGEANQSTGRPVVRGNVNTQLVEGR